ncbi:hypothetical protein BS47DRAFT_1350196 [Hydnum rufescens UP504]|uniref:RNase H type-1 domain-containing protein n=1 Tax=Hydnum rufescens UP504 TaxID=1448309 RepID=A0A9P6DN36_9AGAM|nr:hypothetical protein BS47DRAFT_1350196 [Hydnum rufescens UP504]
MDKRYEIETTLSWVPSHHNIVGNERSDTLAKRGQPQAAQAAKIPLSRIRWMHAELRLAKTMDPTVDHRSKTGGTIQFPLPPPPRRNDHANSHARPSGSYNAEQVTPMLAATM